jgi:hypothetical protein
VASFSATNSLTATQISSENDSFSGQIIANTTCQAGHDAVKESNLNVGVICDLDISAPGAGILRISGPDTFTVDRALQVYDAGARAVNTGYTRTERERTVGKPTIPRTAPVWGGFLGALLAMLLPVFRRRRTPPEEVEPERVLVTV